MNNPWQEINLDTYENHMKSEAVFQLQTLNQITKEQCEGYGHEIVGILGVAGGNGLDGIDLHTTNKIYGFDINEDYLAVCQSRYAYMGNTLELVQCDIRDHSFTLPKTDLLLANLIIEYVGDASFVSFINQNRNHVGVVSCTIQNSQADGFVSQSDYKSAFDPLLSISHTINAEKLIHLFANENFSCLKTQAYTLPNGKTFIRLDFKKS
ncbi:class I SAM-dependent methyltransferase [Paenibacillus sinopodophylli]|uniref:class I SAM-dependent methyltransferase n=1 Tax=Paenibacillus sinopodophylli TaxID=1837342 RepID=UPI00110CE7C7|nr:class I SAM-dependent methyltransferase [Paenibacillus sinopodophylli]